MLRTALRQAIAGPWLRDPLWTRARAVPSLDLDPAGTGSLRDRVSGLDLVTFTRASNGTRITSQGTLETLGNDVPRFTHDPSTGRALGLLVEEARTNSIRNNTMVGAVAGTPGTLPTNWNESLAGLTRTVVATGVDSGISYIDVRLNGTTTGTEAVIQFEANTQVTVTAASSWTGSMYVGLVAGTMTNVSLIGIRMREANAAGALIAAGYNYFIPGTSLLVRQRIAHTITTGGSTERLNMGISIGLSGVGVAVDITLRIGLPQLEQGAFATSPILTTGSAATRAADVATITGTNFSRWYRQDEGTVYGNYSVGNAARVFMFDDQSTNNRWELRFNATADQLSSWSGGVQDVTAIFSASGFSPFASLRTATANATNNAAVSSMGATPAQDNSCTMPVGQSRLFIGSFQGTASFANGTISRFTYWPRRLSNPVLQDLTR